MTDTLQLHETSWMRIYHEFDRKFGFIPMADIITELNEQKRKVDFNTYDISVKELISMVGDSIVNIAPEYQRQFRWKEERQSVLIESIFFGYPYP